MIQKFFDIGNKTRGHGYKSLRYISMKRRMENLNLPGIIEGNYDCPFCDLEISTTERIVEQNDLALCVRDMYPVANGHSLIIPKRHVIDYFELNEAELLCIHRLVISQSSELMKLDGAIKGFNIGVNCGIVAGQSVWHCHIHLIPRKEGDTEYPKGGVRHVIPLKDSDYLCRTKKI